jgi:hypothetical protein
MSGRIVMYQGGVRSAGKPHAVTSVGRRVAVRSMQQTEGICAFPAALVGVSMGSRKARCLLPWLIASLIAGGHAWRISLVPRDQKPRETLRHDR